MFIHSQVWPPLLYERPPAPFVVIICPELLSHPVFCGDCPCPAAPLSCLHALHVVSHLKIMCIALLPNRSTCTARCSHPCAKFAASVCPHPHPFPRSPWACRTHFPCRSAPPLTYIFSVVVTDCSFSECSFERNGPWCLRKPSHLAAPAGIRWQECPSRPRHSPSSLLLTINACYATDRVWQQKLRFAAFPSSPRWQAGLVLPAGGCQAVDAVQTG